MARSSEPLLIQPTNENSKEKHSTRAVAAAAATIVASDPSPVATRSGAAAAAAKLKTKAPAKTKFQQLGEYIPRLPPKPPLRRFGCWASKKIKVKSMPHEETVDQRDHPPPHDALLPYWGDVDDEALVSLFDVPTADYVPLKYPASAKFTDTQKVSSYLINYMPSFIK